MGPGHGTDGQKVELQAPRRVLRRWRQLHRHCQQLVGHIISRICPILTIVLSQDETSEKLIGEWAEKRGIRDQLFIATKVNRAP